MNREAYFAADVQLVKFDNVDIIATSVDTGMPDETLPEMPSMGPNDTEIL